ncbi:hypothetical protein AALM99_04740 [Lactococcus muris]|uniref:Phage protein n=1 Tax=Lactococcus muris TaxID=2941330 RepID=A0ABV4DB17_9LACT
MKYVVKVPYMSAQGLHSYYTVSTREEAEYIAKQCLNAEIIEEAQDEEV